LRLRHKVWAATVAGTAWLGIVAAQAADAPVSSLTSASQIGTTSASGAGDGATWPARSLARAAASPDSSTTEPTAGPAVQAAGQPAASQVTPTTAAPRTAASAPAGYAAGGSMSGSSPVSQAYAQTTQPGWGCPAALQYLAEHANPQFQLVCPGYAMGHQAMTCYYLQGECPNTAEIVIADPCPAAYENEAWNSWHMGTGPYDPYGWCSDWGKGGPVAPAPQPPSAGTMTPAL
jgi:hypothetical protein